jgi:hypothetical protein
VNLWPKVSNSGVSYASIPVLGYVNGVGTGANLLERGYCRGSKSVIGGTSSSTSKAGAVQGAHSYILKVIGAKGTAGSVYVNWHTKAVLGATVSGTVDIGNDNSVEFTGKANVAERKNSRWCSAARRSRSRSRSTPRCRAPATTRTTSTTSSTASSASRWTRRRPAPSLLTARAAARS